MTLPNSELRAEDVLEPVASGKFSPEALRSLRDILKTVRARQAQSANSPSGDPDAR
jgi:hypothetical protein